MDELVTLAMAGTQRRALTFHDPVFAGLSGSPEEQLLGGAALASLSALAGQPLERGAAMPPDMEVDPRPLAPLTALLRVMRDFRSLLPEWLDLARQTGKRPDPSLLPELLEMGRTDRAMRPALALVSGSRALWLARQRGEWNYLLGESEDPQIWETGSSTVRLDWLARLRQRDPRQARELLLSTWAQESAEDRARGLEALDQGLSMEDEDFLERALDDRSKGVRLQAARLLSSLTQSRLSLRMAQRLGSQPRAMQPPQECGPDLQRDGVEPKSPRRDLGDKAWWLQQMVSMAPLPDGPAECLATPHDWSEALLEGWAQAAVQQKNPLWAKALLERGRRDDGLFLLVSHALQEQAILACPEPPLNWLRLHRPFSPRLGEKLLQWLRARTALDFDYHLAGALEDLAAGFPYQLASVVETGWPQSSPAWYRWRAPCEAFVERIRFRQSMVEEMKQ